MSFAEIEDELKNMTPVQLRELAMKSWSAYVEKLGSPGNTNECEEDDPALLSALDEAVAKADKRSAGFSVGEVRAQLGKWISK